MIIRTRVAPSPTGYIHLGFISRVLISYALSKKNNGQFIWRNEDTDRIRFIPDALEFNMKWVREFGLDWDEGPDKGGPYAPYSQSERLPLYKEAYEKLIVNGYAYKCFCTKERLDKLRVFQIASKQQTKYDGLCRNLTQEEIEENLKNNKPFTVRVKVPKNRKIEFTDAITHNHIIWSSDDVDDYIIVKSDGIPTYHLAMVVDDISMKITHVFRGSEWISTTPVHVLIYEGLGIDVEKVPLIGHFTVILDPQNPGKKMSKRNNSFKANGLLQKGYLKEAILNYLMLLGWAPKDNRELFTLNEYVDTFDLNGMQKANPTWDYKKMDWFNGIYIRKLSISDLVQEFLQWISKYLLTTNQKELEEYFINEQFNTKDLKDNLNLAIKLLEINKLELKKQITLVQERAINFWDILTQIKFFYFEPVNIDFDIKQLKNIKEKLFEIKSDLFKLINSMQEDSSQWRHDDWEKGIRDIGNSYNLKHGDIFMTLRVFVVGAPFSPPLFESLQIIGKDEVIKRLKTS